MAKIGLIAPVSHGVAKPSRRSSIADIGTQSRNYQHASRETELVASIADPRTFRSGHTAAAKTHSTFQAQALI
jgi:hypothetical protein